jgi:glycine hydroxymethyltransferase
MSQFRLPLCYTDPEVTALLDAELDRQRNSIELIASENFTSRAVLECLGSVATNKYSEGQIGKRYYGGNEVIDKLESLAVARALTAFHLDSGTWGVNVQPYSGSVANAAVYLGILKPGDTLMGLDLPSGGHLTHGYRTPTKGISSSGIYYNSVAYKVGADGLIDYDEMDRLVDEARPKLIICGASAYPYDFIYERFRAAADRVGAYLMADIAHIAGFVATGLMRSPFEFCDIVTTTTHKTLRGPRAGMIFYKVGLKTAIEGGVFPGLQGGPHENQIAAIATQMREVATEEYKQYMAQVRANARALTAELKDIGYTVTETDNHLFLLDLRNKGLTGAQAERALELSGISVNKNMIYGDKSALRPSGLRIGTPAVTSRGLLEVDMGGVAQYINDAIVTAQRLVMAQESLGGKFTKEELDRIFTESEDFKYISECVRRFIRTKPFYEFFYSE